MFVYVGTYTEAPQGAGEGIYVCRFDPASGALTPVQAVPGLANPSFLAVAPGGRHLYAVVEGEEGQVAAFDRDPQTGGLRELNRQPSGGAAPCHVSLDASGRYALVANYTSGTLAVLPVDPDGRLRPATDVIRHEGSGPDPARQDGPHAHMVAPAPDGRAVLATDLGTDAVWVYRLDAAAGRLVPHGRARARAGAGPRHFAFAPDGRTVYVLNELDSTLTAYAYDGAAGTLTPRQTVPALPEGFAGENTCAQVVVAPDGRFVYGSNRGHDSVATWAVDGASGELRPAGHTPTGGATPRNVALDPTGAWLLAANQGSGTVVSFRRDPDSGALTPTGQVAEIPAPVVVVFREA